MRKTALALTASVAALAAVTAGAASGSAPLPHQPIYMPNTQNVGNPTLQPPPVCCSPQGPPVAGEPAPVNMAYFGGHVQIDPKIYLVYWGWGSSRREMRWVIRFLLLCVDGGPCRRAGRDALPDPRLLAVYPVTGRSSPAPAQYPAPAAESLLHRLWTG